MPTDGASCYESFLEESGARAVFWLGQVDFRNHAIASIVDALLPFHYNTEFNHIHEIIKKKVARRKIYRTFESLILSAFFSEDNACQFLILAIFSREILRGDKCTHNTDFFQDSRFFSKISKRYIYSWRNLLEIDKNRNCIFLSFFHSSLFYQNLRFLQFNYFKITISSVKSISKFRITLWKSREYSRYSCHDS